MDPGATSVRKYTRGNRRSYMVIRWQACIVPPMTASAAAKIPSHISIPGVRSNYRLRLDVVDDALAVTLSERATRHSGHTSPAGVDAGDTARALRRSIAKRVYKLAEAADLTKVEVYANTRGSTWLVDEISVG